MKRKRILSLIMTAVMVATITAPATIFAQGAEWNGGDETASLQAGAQAEAVVVPITGPQAWSVIERQIEQAVAATPGTSVRVVGADDTATIIFSDEGLPVDGLGRTRAIECITDTEFDNVTLRTETENIAVFANGHRLRITDSVQTSGDQNRTFTIFGGGNRTNPGNTHIAIDGGDWARIYGGSYRAEAGDTYVHVAGDAAVLYVYGGCYGDVTTGNIYVEYGGARAYMSDVSGTSYQLACVMGGGHDVRGEEQAADVTGDNLTVRILPGALLNEVAGAQNSMLNCKDIYITVEKGANVLRSVSGGATTSSAGGGDTLAKGYAPTVKHYQTNADIHVVMNGEGRLDDTKAYSASVTGGGIFAQIHGEIEVVVNGNVEYVYGGNQYGDVHGNINVTINGGVYAGGHNADIEIGDVGNWYGGTVTGGCLDGTVDGNITTTINKDAEVHAIIGGSDDGGVTGSTNVHVYGTILKKNYQNSNRYLRYAGCVFGAGYVGEISLLDESDVFGQANVYIHEGADVQGDVYGGGAYGRCSAGSKVFVSGTVQGDVYGGGWVADGENKGWLDASTFIYLGYTNGAYVELNGNARARNVYGGGRTADIHGNSEVVLKDNARVENVYGTGNAFSTYYLWGQMQQIGPVVTETTGDATIRIQDNAAVADTIYGYELVDVEGEKVEKLAGKAHVYFEHSTGEFKRVVNADLVHVTEESKVTIDNKHKDDEQLVHVSDLTIDDSAALKLGADAHILGNYRGDAAKSGTLNIPAGKCLTADGTVTDLTRISIYDFDGVIPEKAQIYVISGAGSTTAEGDFTWVDTRNGVYMDWRVHNDGRSTQWWLVNDPNPNRYGALAVYKTVAGDGGDTNKEFHFTVTLSDTSINGQFGDMEFHNGVASFTLKHGESKTAVGLLSGTAYTVTETQANQDGYVTACEGEVGTIVQAQTAEAKFTNTKNNVPIDASPTPTSTPTPDLPKTGEHGTALPMMLFIAGAGVLVASLALRKRRA